MKYSPVGKCIYCGAASYGIPTRPQLAEEHIIPLALKGEFILPEASCHLCEKEINRFEQPLLKGVLLPSRAWFAMKSRKKRKQDELTLFDSKSKAAVNMSIAEHPIPLFLPTLNYPHILTGAPNHLLSNARELWAANLNSQKLTKQKGRSTEPLDTYALFRFLAKIGHSFAAAELGIGNFTPLLNALILGKDIERRFYFIGGPRRHLPAGENEGIHRLDLLSLRVRGSLFVIARVRIFAQLGAPIYYVVVGTMNG